MQKTKTAYEEYFSDYFTEKSLDCIPKEILEEVYYLNRFFERHIYGLFPGANTFLLKACTDFIKMHALIKLKFQHTFTLFKLKLFIVSH